jgi:hypothetical protein
MAVWTRQELLVHTWFFFKSVSVVYLLWFAQTLPVHLAVVSIFNLQHNFFNSSSIFNLSSMLSTFTNVTNLLGNYPDSLIYPIAQDELVVSLAINFEELTRSSLVQGFLVPVLTFNEHLPGVAQDFNSIEFWPKALYVVQRLLKGSVFLFKVADGFEVDGTPHPSFPNGLPVNAVLPTSSDERVFVLSAIALDNLKTSASAFAVAVRARLTELHVIAVAPEDLQNFGAPPAGLLTPASSSIAAEQATGWNPFFVQGEFVPSVSQQAFQAKMLKVRPLYRLLHGNRARLQEIVGPSKDLSDGSDCAHFVSQLLPRELKDVPAFAAGNFENTMRFRFTDAPRLESKNKFSACFPALFHPLNKDGSVHVFYNAAELWNLVMVFTDILDRLVGSGHFYKDVFAPITLALTDSSIGALKFIPNPKFIVHLISSKFVAFGDLLNNDSVKDLEVNEFRQLCLAVLQVDVPSESMRFVIAHDQFPNQFSNSSSNKRNLIASSPNAGGKSSRSPNKFPKPSPSGAPLASNSLPAVPPLTNSGKPPNKSSYCVGFFAKELGIGKGCKAPANTCAFAHVKKPPVGVPLDPAVKGDLIAFVSSYSTSTPFKDSFLKEIQKL